MHLRWHLSHIQGYLGLDMIAEAAAELEEIAPADRDSLEFLGLHMAILQEQKKWPALRTAAAEFVRRQPDAAGAWITWAYATRRAESLEAVGLPILSHAAAYSLCQAPAGHYSFTSTL